MKMKRLELLEEPERRKVKFQSNYFPAEGGASIPQRGLMAPARVFHFIR